MVCRNRRLNARLGQQCGRLFRQVVQFRLRAVRQKRSRANRHMFLCQNVRNQMRFGSVQNHRLYRKFLGDAQRSENIIRPMCVKMCRTRAVQHRQQRLIFRIILRQIRWIFRVLLLFSVLLRLVQRLPNERGRCHARHRRLIFVIVARFWVLSQRKLHRARLFDNHVINAASCRLNRRNLSGNRVAAARRPQTAGDSRFARLLKAAFHRVDAVNHAQLRRDRVGVLISVLPFETEGILKQAQMRVRIDKPRQNPSAVHVCVLALRHIFHRPHSGNLSIFHGNITVFDDFSLHWDNFRIAKYHCFSSKTIDIIWESWYDMFGGRKLLSMHRSYLYPHNPFTLRLAEGYFFICTKKADMTMPLSRDCSWKRDIVACFVLIIYGGGNRSSYPYCGADPPCGSRCPA